MADSEAAARQVQAMDMEDGISQEKPLQVESSMTWSNIEFLVGEKQILKKMSGSIRSGDSCAIMGPSGSGKTSLMNVLARRVRSRGKKRVLGDVRLDGKRIDSASSKKIAYVMQEDVVLPTATPREAILFSALLRLPRSMPTAEKKQRVTDLIEELQLSHCADTAIGNTLKRGISGGEKKRTAIAIELVTQPQICFLDEPTSGLDSFAAYKVVSTLRALAEHGRVVLSTIHQPSSETFHLFSKVLVLEMGRLFFLGTSAQLSKQLTQLGHPCPAEYNLADHLLYLLQTAEENELLRLEEEMVGGGKGISTDGESVMALQSVTATSALAAASSTEAVDEKGVARRQAGLFRQLRAVLWREMQSTVRNKPALIASIMVPFFLNLLFGVLFIDSGDINQSDYTVRTHFGGITQIAIGGMFGASQSILIKIPLKRGLFIREYAAGTYSATAFFTAVVLQDLIESFIRGMITFLVSYWLMSLNGSFILFVLTFWVSAQAIAAISLLLGVAVSDVESAATLQPVVLVPQILFAGFFIESEQIPVWIRWAQWLCVLKYNINLDLIIEFGSDTIKDWPEDLRLEAEGLLESNNVEEDQWWVYLLILLLISTCCYLISIPILIRRAIV